MKNLIFAIAIVIAAGAAVPAAKAGDNDAVVVSRGTAEVTLRDIDDYMENHIPQKDRAGFMSNGKRVEALLLNMLLQKQLANDARRIKLDEEDNLKGATDEVLARARLDKVVKDLEIPDMEQLAQEKYAVEKSKFVERGTSHVKQIIIREKLHPSEEAAKLASEVWSQAKEHPDQFDALIEIYSEDANKQVTHGVLNTLDGQEKPLIVAANEMEKPHDISRLGHFSEGFFVLQLISRDSATQKSYEEIHDALISELKNEYISNRRNAFRDALANEKMEANPELVGSLSDRYSDTALPSSAPAYAAPQSN